MNWKVIEAYIDEMQHDALCVIDEDQDPNEAAVVCVVSPVCSLENADKTHANLIASAPELLAALNLLLAYQPPFELNKYTHNVAIHQAKAAIAKAEGVAADNTNKICNRD